MSLYGRVQMCRPAPEVRVKQDSKATGDTPATTPVTLQLLKAMLAEIPNADANEKIKLVFEEKDGDKALEIHRVSPVANHDHDHARASNSQPGHPDCCVKQISLI